jgi:hypothetical protein
LGFRVERVYGVGDDDGLDLVIKALAFGIQVLGFRVYGL